MHFQRYAIYYTPKPGKLADFGATWLGWDIATGLPVPHAIIQGLKEDLSEITEVPRKYGFHGTIKPPFRLSPGSTEAQLLQATETLCAKLSPIRLEGLELSKLGRFLALTATGSTEKLSALASTIVQELDAFRAPATEAEFARRRKAKLTARQESNLLQWGYPHVMEDFRFHMTLTGRLDKTRAQALQPTLAAVLAPSLQAPFVIDDLTLAGEEPNGRFIEIKRIPLGKS